MSKATDWLEIARLDGQAESIRIITSALTSKFGRAATDEEVYDFIQADKAGRLEIWTKEDDKDVVIVEAFGG